MVRLGVQRSLKPRHPNIEAEILRMDALPVKQSCLFCTWIYEGTAVDGRTEAIAHRLEVHPEIKPKRRPPTRNLQSFRQPRLKTEDREEIFTERDRRAKLLGIDVI